MGDYIILNDHKQPKHSFKNGGKSWETVKDEENIARIVPYPFIVLDFDTESDSRIMLDIIKGIGLKCSIMKTTRGIHCYFRSDEPWKCFTKSRLACGLYCDCKSHSKNAYTVIRQNGKDREWIQRLPADQIEAVPKFLYPVNAPERFSFKGMGEGDGRNQELFNYIPFLNSKDFTKEEIKETLRIINDYIFDEPLPEREINAITRDESFAVDPEQGFYQNNKLLHEKVGDYMINEYHIAKYEGQLIIYENGFYLFRADTMAIINRRLRKTIHNLTKRQKAEILDYINDLAPEVTLSSPRYILFSNGVYDLEREELLPHDPKYVILNKIRWNYDELAYSQVMDEALNKLTCNDPTLRALLEEMVGYCFYRKNVFRKCFVLVGEKRNGKSTFLNALETILGNDNYSSLDMRNIGDRFSTVQLFRKLANIGDDISDDYIPDSSVFKKTISGESLTAEYKGRDKFNFMPYCKLIFSANTVPRMKDETEASSDRMITLPFDAVFSEHDPGYDPYIKDKLLKKESIEYLICLGMEGLKRILRNKGFTYCKRAETMLQGYRLYNNPVRGFYEDHDKEYIFEHSRNSQYLHFKAWCEDSGIKPETRQQFYKSVVRLYEVECYETTKDGTKGRYFRAKL